MGYPLSDPLDGISQRPTGEQLAILVSEMQNLRGRVNSMEERFTRRIEQMEAHFDAALEAANAKSDAWLKMILGGLITLTVTVSAAALTMWAVFK